MHHYLSFPDWIDEVKEDLAKMRVRKNPHDIGAMAVPPVHSGFDPDLLQEDHNRGREPEDVAADIIEGRHPRMVFSTEYATPVAQ